MDNLSTSFGKAVGAYDRGRPGYPAEAVAWLLETIDRPARILDVGAGTGKLTRVLVDAGHEVVALDPDPVMLEALKESLPGVTTVIGRAEEIPLDDRFDAAVSGQAWHWVEPVAASREVGRVVRPGGVLGLIWNTRDTSVGWVARLSEIMHHSRAETYIDNDELAVHHPFEPPHKATFRWSRQMTRNAIFDMVHSRSYVITAPTDVREQIDSRITDLLDEHGVDGDRTIELPYVTSAFRSLRSG